MRRKLSLINFAETTLNIHNSQILEIAKFLAKDNQNICLIQSAGILKYADCISVEG